MPPQFAGSKECTHVIEINLWLVMGMEMNTSFMLWLRSYSGALRWRLVSLESMLVDFVALSQCPLKPCPPDRLFSIFRFFLPFCPSSYYYFSLTFSSRPPPDGSDSVWREDLKVSAAGEITVTKVKCTK